MIQYVCNVSKVLMSKYVIQLILACN